MRNFHIILAMDSKRGIGKNGTLPWKIKEDMKYFKEMTSKTNDPNKVNAVIMGRKTWESIPNQWRPLSGRLNIVISNHHETLYDGSVKVPSFEMALENANYREGIENIFVIGGSQVYNEALKHPLCDLVFVTEIESDFDCDTFVDPIIKTNFRSIVVGSEIEEKGIKYRFCSKEKI